jgi:peptide/nickel transport system substrate-binding protein
MLRQEVIFHNGEPFSAGTERYKLQRVIDPDLKSPQGGNIAYLERVDMVDDYTVRLITQEPHPSFRST